MNILSLEESNKLAETIMESGEIWLLPYGKQKVEVEPVMIQMRGRMAVFVKAVEGSPFYQKDKFDGGRVFKYRSAYKWVYPEQLEKPERKR